MRLNRFVAQATGMSRRAADTAIQSGRVRVGQNRGEVGRAVDDTHDRVYLDGVLLKAQPYTTIVLNKPVGYVVSRQGQGSKTIYGLLPKELHHLKPVGRLDKDSSGLLLLTNDGKLAAELTHPSSQKEKVYEVTLDRPLTELHRIALEKGVQLDDGLSQLRVSSLASRISHRTQTTKLQQQNSNTYEVHLHEGRNRQIRRTFAALGYTVTRLHRTNFGSYQLGNISEGNYSTSI